MDVIDFSRQYWLPLIFAVVGLIFLGSGLIFYFDGKRDKPDILFEAASTSNVAGDVSTSSTSDAGAISVKQNKQQKLIAVDVEGGVENPGVYKIPADSRVQDGLIAAGGLSSNADREIVARSLNLATKLIDGMKIYIPLIGEGAGGAVMGIGGSALVNINSASASELDELPGIGKATADKIISNRPYGAIEELVSKKAVGRGVFEQIKEKIVAQ